MPTNSFSIRQTTDHDLVLRVRKLAIPTGDWAGPCDGVLWWVASVLECKTPTYVATAGLKVIEKENVGYLYYACVIPSYRGQGLQKKLIRARVRKAKQLGLEGCLTYTLIDNYPSANSLMGEGFRMYYPETPWQGDDVWYFQKLF